MHNKKFPICIIQNSVYTITSSETPVNTAVGYVPLFVGSISRAVADTELQEMFRTKAIPGRFHRKGNFGFAKVLVPNGEVDQALNQDLVLYGRKLRVEKWRDQPVKAPRPPRVHRLASASATSGVWTEHRNGNSRQVVRGPKISSAAYTASEDISLIKKRAHFLAEFLSGHGLQNLVFS